MTTDQSWLEHYAFIAVWLEAVALIAIFIWDRVDAIRELEVARNTERAWLLTDLDWPDRQLGYVLGSGKGGETTTFFMVLKCRNAGGVPAWIDKVHGYAELVEGELEDLSSPVGHEVQQFAVFGPIAPSERESSNVAFECKGNLRNDQIARASSCSWNIAMRSRRVA